MNTSANAHPHIVLNPADECVGVFALGTSPTGKPCLILEARTAYTPQLKALANGAGQSGHNGGGAREGETALTAAVREASEEFGIAFDASQLTYLGKVEQLQPAKWKYVHVFTVRVSDFTWAALTESAGRVAVVKDDLVHRVARGQIRLATFGIIRDTPALHEWLPSPKEALSQILDVLASCEQGFSTQNVAGLMKMYDFTVVLSPPAKAA